MVGKLLDTNAVTALQKNDAALLRLLETDVEVFVPAVVIGELYYGAHHSSRVEANLAFIAEFVAENTILVCDAETAQHYGRIKNCLRAAGRPIPENDIWIAAVAIQYDLAVVTQDAHFRQIDGLLIEAW